MIFFLFLGLCLIIFASSPAMVIVGFLLIILAAALDY